MFISGCVQKVCPPQLLKPMTFFFLMTLKTMHVNPTCVVLQSYLSRLSFSSVKMTELHAKVPVTVPEIQ